MKLDDRIAIVTGAASGIGLATAQRLAEAGATVMLGDIDDARGEQAGADLRAAGLRADYAHCDVTSDASVAALPQMIERKQGKIVNVSSDAGRVGSLGETVYSGAKGGVIAFTKGLARETARHGITANCVCPGPTDTPLLQAVPEKHREAFQRAIPMKRFARPSEIADAVVFFASGRSDYITGQVLSVSGGLSMVG